VTIKVIMFASDELSARVLVASSLITRKIGTLGFDPLRFDGRTRLVLVSFTGCFLHCWPYEDSPAHF